MVGVTDLPTFLVGVVAIILLPGPNSMYVLSVATRKGVAAAYLAAAAVFIGDTVLMIVSAAGAASVLRANPMLFTVIKYSGAAYLAWLAVGMMRAAWTRWRGRGGPDVPAHDGPAEDVPAEDVSAEDVSAEHAAAGSAASASVVSGSRSRSERPFARALIVSVLNPKAALFFVAFFVQFVDPTYPRPWLSFLLLGAVVQVVSLSYLTGLIFVGARVARALGRHRWVAAAGTAAVGLLFAGFAAKLALASL